MRAVKEELALPIVHGSAKFTSLILETKMAILEPAIPEEKIDQEQLKACLEK